MRRGGYTCLTADDGVDVLMLLKNNPVDLMILDIMMPNLDGFTVCKIAREMSSLPIILLTAKSAEEDKLKGYEYGVDDYMTKPFSPRVLLAKVNALLRHFSAGGVEAVNAGKITIFPAAHQVFVDGRRFPLPTRNMSFCLFSWQIPGRYFPGNNC